MRAVPGRLAVAMAGLALATIRGGLCQYPGEQHERGRASVQRRLLRTAGGELVVTARRTGPAVRPPAPGR